ncbi:MAG: adenylyl-sulfate kinase [Flavobacteriaceae bacterium]
MALYKKLKKDLRYLTQNTAEDLRFNEYYDAIQHLPSGAKRLCFSAAGILFSDKNLKSRHTLFGVPKENNSISYNDIAIDVIDKLDSDCRLVFIAGESGSGKTTLAKNLKKELTKKGISAYVMSQDNYFHLPPNQNHAKRVESISWVGQNEVNFQLMKDHIQVLTKKSKSKIDVPIINRLFDRFDTTELKVEDYDMLIVEGTYAFEIAEKQSFKIFMTQTYRETKKIGI